MPVIRVLRNAILISFVSIATVFAQGTTLDGTWSMHGDFSGPGSTGNNLYVAVQNTVDMIATIEVHYDTLVLAMDPNVKEALNRAIGLGPTASGVYKPYRRFALLNALDPSKVITTGSGDVLRLAFSVNANVALGTSTTITLTDQAAKTTLATLNVTINKTVKGLTIQSPLDGATLSVDEGRKLLVKFSIQNAGDSLRLNAGTLPTGATMVSDTLLQWTPSQSQSGTYNLRLIYSNEASGVDTVNLTITVNNVNAPPVWPTSYDTLLVNENEALSHTFSAATDADPLDVVSYSALNLPGTTSKFNSTTLTFTWTPSFGRAGTYQFSLVASDNSGGRATKIVTVIVAKVNRKPSLKLSSTAVNATEKDDISVLVASSDPDGDPVLITASGVPQGAGFSGNVFSWRNPVAGSYTVQFVGKDPGGLADTQSVSITVTAVNYAPHFVALRDTSVDAGQPVQITLQATDQNSGDVLTYSIRKITGQTTLLDRGATLNGNVFSWTTSTADIGPNIVLVRVEDGNGGFDNGQININVTGRNIKAPPTFKPLDTQNLTEGSSFIFDLPLVNPNLTGLKFWAQNWPQGSTLDSLTGRFAWRPNLRQSGSYTVTFGVTDGNFQDTKKMQLVVAERDVPPILSTVGNLSVVENQTLKVKLSAVDSSGEAVSFSATGLPTGAVLYPQGLLQFTPGYDQAGNYPVTFTVTDGSGNKDQESVNLEVKDANRPPVLSADDQVVSENATLSFTVSATDPDGDALTYAAQAVPQGATFSAQSHAFDWTPTTDQSGNYSVLFTASDGKAGGTDSATVVISVGNVNRPPVLYEVGDQSVEEGGSIAFSVVASDPDAANSLSISFSGLPTGTVVTKSGTNPATFTVNYIATYTQAGDYIVKATATDNDATNPLSVSRKFKLTVSDVDVAPSFTGSLAGGDTVSMSTSEGQVLSFDVSASDAGGDQLSYSVISLPANTTVQLNTSPRTVVFAPDYTQSGTQTIVLAVTDGNNVVTKTVQVSVAEVNRAPRVNQIADQSVGEGDIITFAVSADDPDGDSLHVFTAGRVPFLTQGSNPPARIRDGNVFVFDTALLDKANPIASAVFKFWAVDSRDGVSDTVSVEIKVVRKDSLNVPAGLSFILSPQIGGPLGLNFLLGQSGGAWLLKLFSQSGFASHFNWTPSLLASAGARNAPAPEKQKKGVYPYLSGDLVSQFYGIRRGWGLDLTGLASAGADSFPAGTNPKFTLNYYDADLPTEVPNFSEARLAVFGYDASKSVWVMMDSVLVDTVKNEASFVPTDPQITDYTIGAVLDVIAPQITNVKFVSSGYTYTPAALDTLFGLNGTYEVRVNITDDNVVSSTDAEFYYSLNGGAFQALALTRQPGNLFTATISAGAQTAGTTLDYYVTARDTMNAVTLPVGAPQTTRRLILAEQTRVSGDLDNNNKVDVFDLLGLLKVLGGKQATSAASDVNADGKTDVFDLLALLKKLAH